MFTAACTHFYEIPIETRIQAKLDVSAFQRVLVAGFIAGGSQDIDAHVETTRLLRSQLRTKSDLRVIDADTGKVISEKIAISEKIVEIDFRDGVPIAARGQNGGVYPAGKMHAVTRN